MNTTKVRTWLGIMRIPFLIMTPIYVLLGISVSIHDGNPFNAWFLVLSFLGALFAHISVNVFNEYFDYKSGVDFKTKRTPFSGGSGVLPSRALDPKKAFYLAIGTLVLLVLIGVYFVSVYGWPILILGLVGVFLIFFYTILLAKLYIVSEISAGGFALIVFGTYFVQNGNCSWSIAILTLISWLLISNLLLLNEFPDVEADRTDGRKHLPIILGREKSAKIYSFVMVLIYVILLGAVVLHFLPLTALLGLATLPLALKTIVGVLKHHSDSDALVPYLGTNVVVMLLTPLLVSIGMIIWVFLF
ncbi:MAG: prenyltransferase [Methanomassiliicoccales archaeon]|nr:MAG: prenyltransferase [Methanomassiliicoccales archaeon]